MSARTVGPRKIGCVCVLFVWRHLSDLHLSVGCGRIAGTCTRRSADDLVLWLHAVSARRDRSSCGKAMFHHERKHSCRVLLLHCIRIAIFVLQFRLMFTALVQE